MDGKIAELQKKVEQSQSECKQLESRKLTTVEPLAELCRIFRQSGEILAFSSIPKLGPPNKSLQLYTCMYIMLVRFVITE